MKKIIVRVKEIENPKDKSDVYITLYSILDDLACYSSVVYDNLIAETYRDAIGIEMECDCYMPYLKQIIRENKCNDYDGLLNALEVIKQVVVKGGLSQYEFDYDIEETSTNSFIVSIAIFA